MVAEASVTFAVGSEQVTVVLPVDLPAGGETILTGDIGGLVAAGTVARLRGACRLIDNLHVRGTLLCDPTGVDLDGQNLYDIHTHDGTLNLVGVEKTAWCRWGDAPVGWQVGDRLAVAPTAVGVYVSSETTWQGSWAATTRPVNSPDVTLIDGSTARPEVANLSQTVTFRNLKRIMIHESSAPNPQTFKWIRVLNSGESGVLGMYPIHFHMIGDYARGSIHEGVVVEGGKNHAFVPHASHGISYRNCVAYNGKGYQYWWDPPIPNQTPRHTANDTNDLVWDDCLALGVTAFAGDPGNTRLAGFSIGSGTNMSCVGSAAAAVGGNPNSGARSRSGFHWPENASLTAWDFRNCVSHNNAENGVMTWQNTEEPHFVDDSVIYRNGYAGVNHGAYSNQYRYARLVISQSGIAVVQHAKTGEGRSTILLFEDIVTDGLLMVPSHNSASMAPSFHRRCTYPQVVYQGEGANGSFNKYEDCGLTPADFNLAGIAATSIIEIYESGVLAHRWQSGVWS